MKNNKSIKLGYGVLSALVLGLSGCYMDSPNPNHVDYSSAHPMHHTTQATTGETHLKQKTYSTKEEPAQKVTPGPKRAAAPQLPVIQ